MTLVGTTQETPEDTVGQSESNLVVFISSVMTEELRWAREEARRAFEEFPFAHVWTFEFTPASSESPTDTYLRKVQEADFVVWLVGSTTTEPVVNEIHTCIATDRRLLVFTLPTQNRDEATQRLLKVVSCHVKWQDVDNPAALGQGLKASISDELIRALRDPVRPARQRQLREWRDLSLAYCEQSWLSLGVPHGLAHELAQDRSIGDVITPSSANLQMIVGDGGAGKSLAASRVFQLAIDRALQDGNARFPVFVNARGLHEPLDEYIKTKTTGLVQPFHQQTLIIIDGLDETGVSRANELIGQVHVYLRAYKNSIVLLTTRPLPGLKAIDQYTTLDPLHDTVAVDLIGRIAGRRLELAELYSWSASMRDAATRPLFAVMIGTELRQRNAITLDRPAGLINRLAEQAVTSGGGNAPMIDGLLKTLAVKAISTGRRVPRSHVSLNRAELTLLRDSRVIDESRDTFDFTHQLLREWYAARALIEGHTSIEEVCPASDRWLTSFGLVIKSDNTRARDTLRHTLASSDPGLASLLIPERDTTGVVEETSDRSRLTAQELGETLWMAMDSWRKGLGELFQLIGPVGLDGRTATAGVKMDSTSVMTSWYGGSRTQPRVVELPDMATKDLWEFDRGWGDLLWEKTLPGAEWPWTTTRRQLVDSLSKTIKTRRLALPSYHAIRELVWACSLAAKDQGEFSPRPIRTRDVLDIVHQIAKHATDEDTTFRFRQLELTRMEVDLIRDSLTARLEQGEEIISDPWPRFDRTPSRSTRACSTWDFYSDERLLQRVAAVYSAALQLYTDIVDRWFKEFQDRLQFARLLPVRLEGRLRRSRQPQWRNAPSMRWCARALPKEEPSKVTVEWSSEEFDLLSYWKQERDNLKRVRLGVDATPCPLVQVALPAIDSVRPATDLAHACLIGDLRELRWTHLDKLSLH